MGEIRGLREKKQNIGNYYNYYITETRKKPKQKRSGYDHEFVIAPTIAYDHCSQ